MRTILESLKVRREEAARSTSHGLDFGASVGSFVQNEAQRFGDVFENAKDTTGAIPRCKVQRFRCDVIPGSGSARKSHCI